MLLNHIKTDDTELFKYYKFIWKEKNRQFLKLKQFSHVVPPPKKDNILMVKHI